MRSDNATGSQRIAPRRVLLKLKELQLFLHIFTTVFHALTRAFRFFSIALGEVANRVHLIVDIIRNRDLLCSGGRNLASLL